MHPNWKYWLDAIQYHWASITLFSGLATTAAIKTMPTPGAPFSAYEWFYDWAHQFLNLPNNRIKVPAPPNP